MLFNQQHLPDISNVSKILISLSVIVLKVKLFKIFYYLIYYDFFIIVKNNIRKTVISNSNEFLEITSKNFQAGKENRHHSSKSIKCDYKC